MGTAWPIVSQTTMSSAPAVRGSAAMPITRSGSVTPSNGQVNAVAMHSWIEPPTSRAIRTASGIAATLSSVLRPMLALLCESVAEKQYWKFRAPAAAAFSMWRGVATQIQHRSSSSGSSAAMTSNVSASGGTRSPLAIDPISSSGTPSASSSPHDFDLAVGGDHLGGQLESVAQCDVAQLGAWCVGTWVRGGHADTPDDWVGRVDTWSISSSLSCSSEDRISWVCCPRSGPTLRIGSDAWPITGTMPGKPTVLGSSAPMSTVNGWIMFRDAYCSSAQMSAAV